MDADSPLRFVPFSSAVETGFWHKLSQLKLDLLQLSEEAVAMTGCYSHGSVQGLPALFNVDYAAFDGAGVAGGCPGLLVNRNTLDGFRDCDKAALLRGQAESIWEAVVDGTALTSPRCLSAFLLLTFADLKKYDFMYWFCFPALKLPASVVEVLPPQTLSEYLSEGQEAGVTPEAVAAAAASQSDQPAFLLRLHPTPEAQPLSDLTSRPAGDLVLTFRDPSTDPAHPGWPLRNLLALYWHYCGKDRPNLRVLCYRDVTRQGVRSVGHSLLLNLRLSHTDGSSEQAPPATGWERNERGNMGPRRVNLSATMDPLQLAATSVDLNLKLMRWRLVPDLDLDLMTSARCLLLGAGTLGCNVARALLGWGVRHITLVDSGCVSFSNPVRQSLFTFDDSVQRRPKAEAAASRLREIFPGVVSEGVRLSVPMPGHPVSAALQQQVLADVDRLRQLVTSHDVIFLLMDSRESRWLPTLMGAAHQKVVLNAALGFDSYLVMRHGVRPLSEDASPPPSDSCDLRLPIPGHQLGCYFCNDVVAPGNSLQDRTLDQQCTVTRPGVSLVAAGLAVELMAALLQHPLRAEAPVRPRQEGADSPAGPLGGVPHSIRGFLGQLQQLTPATRAYNRCTACSPTVLQRYRQDGDQFLLQVFNRSSYLEDVTGLTELHKLTEAAELWELDDDDCDDF